MLNRRSFVKLGLGSLGLAAASCATSPAPAATPDGAMGGLAEPGAMDEVGAMGEIGEAAPTAPAAKPSLAAPILVVVQLSGGNDGLNTVVPYTEQAYYQSRPTLAIPANQVLPLNDRIGLHPNLKKLKGIWDGGQVAVVQGVGYPNPNRSHFRSMDIWHTAAPATIENYGWLGQYLDIALKDVANPFKAISVGRRSPRRCGRARRRPPRSAISTPSNFGPTRASRLTARRCWPPSAS